MKKYILIFVILLFINNSAYAQWSNNVSVGIVPLADCSSLTSGFCRDTDNGNLYYWDGSNMTLISAAAGAPTDAHYLTDQAEAGLSADVVVSTIGKAVATSTNPGAITFGRANADNTFTWLSAANFRTAIGLDTAANLETSLSLGAYASDILGAANEAGLVALLPNYVNQDVTSDANPSFSTINVVGTNSLNLGTAGSAVGQLTFKNATSGSILVQPITGALGTRTLNLGVTYTDGKWCSYATATGFTCNQDAPAGSGDVTGVGDCTDGVCHDGSSDGGTYSRWYDGTSAYIAGTAGVRTFTIAPSNANAENLVVTFGDNNNTVSLGSGTGATVSINGTSAGLSGTPNITVGTISAGAAGFSVDADGDTTAKSITLAATTSPTELFTDSDAPGTDKEIAKIVGAYVDGADGAENGTLDLYAHEAGTSTSYIQLDGKNTQVEVTKKIIASSTIDLSGTTDATIARSGAGTISVEGTNVLMSGGALGTPSSGTLTNTIFPSNTSLPGTCTVGNFYIDTDADTDGDVYFCRATNTWKAIDDDGGAGGLATTDIDTSAELRTIVGDESGTGALLFAGGDIAAGTATTASANDNDTSIATTAYVQTEITATASDSETLTNKTFDANGTGNVLKGYGYITFTKPHNRGSATGAVGTTETTQLYGVPSFADDSEANNYVDYIAEVPRDWDSAVDPVAYFKFRLGGADTADHDYIVSMIDIADSAAADGTPGDAINLAYTADGSGASGDIETATGTLTGWGAAATAGSYWLIRVTRDGDDGTNDASTVDSYPMELTIRYGFTQ